MEVALDGNGNLYFAEMSSHRIRKVSANGTISTLAGTTGGGFSGDGGAASAAQLFYPAGVAVDAGGNVLIADTGNYRIRKVTPAGIISTIAGTGTAGYSGDGGLARNAQLNRPSVLIVDAAGRIYFADGANNLFRKVDANGTISTVAGNSLAACPMPAATATPSAPEH